MGPVMKIILHLTPQEGHRKIVVEEENIRSAYREIMRQIENVCMKHQINYIDIEVRF
jgi:hypothetical protein